MEHYYWEKEIDASLIVSDENGIVIQMNDKSSKVFEGGTDRLLGTKLLDCHPEWAKPKVQELMSEKEPSCYTTESKGKKHFIYHTPWFEDGEYKGLVEMVIPIPSDMPNYVRD